MIKLLLWLFGGLKFLKLGKLLTTGGTMLLSVVAYAFIYGWRYAAGLGVRYYSSFGPIRVDFGVPLNRQKGDGPFAVTVSLGQAF